MDQINILSAVSIDDEKENIDLLKYFVDKYSPYIKILGEATTIDSGVELIDRIKPDIIFLDIQLNEGLSFDILDKVRYKESKVVFVTGYDGYAIKAFQYNAIDYLLKPLDIEEIVRVANKIRKGFEQKESNLLDQVKDLKRYVREIYSQEYITIPSIKKIDVVRTSDIYYVKSEAKFSVFVTDRGEIISSKNLGVYESLLPKLKFFRVHNSYIVNIDQIKYIHKEADHYCLMRNGKKIPISKRKYQNFIKLIDPSNFF